MRRLLFAAPRDVRSLTRVIAAAAAAAALLWSAATPAADLGIARQFFPESDVTVEQPSGSPPSSRIVAADGRVVGYAFSTRDVSGSVGYSGRPLDIVAAVAPDGIIAGAAIVAHEEPILVIGVPREALVAYVASFKGYGVGGAVGPATRPHAVAGASITSAVIHDAILRSARTVLRTREASSASVRIDRENAKRLTWPAMVSMDAVRRLVVSRGEAAKLLGAADREPDKPFIDLWMALATAPAIGESLLGQRDFEAALAAGGPDDDLIVIGASGLYSFRGTEWRRSGVFDRIELVQGAKSFRLHAADHTPLQSLHAAGAPELREIGLFRIAGGSGFDPTQPFRLDLSLGPAPTPKAPSPVASLDYKIPDSFLKRIQPEAPARAQTAEPSPPAELLWQDIWWARRYELIGLVAMLTTLGAILIFQNQVAANATLYRRLRIAFLLATLIFLGFIAKAQLSVVNVVTFVHALLSGFRWDLFLIDPMVFVLWAFVAVSMLFWGRVFCGWLCPFGALQELLFKLGQRLGIKKMELPFAVHERLWMIKYIAFLAILAVSLHSTVDAFLMAEIEPFKTAIVLRFVRDLPLVGYAVALLVAGLFIERFYCRYLCPLGAALAIPARLRTFEWLNRRRECGSECHVCERTCTVQAINALGHINPNECIYCLQCQANYYDDKVCLTLIRRAARKARAPVAAASPAAAPTSGVAP